MATYFISGKVITPHRDSEIKIHFEKIIKASVINSQIDYEEGIRVPLIKELNANIEGGQRVHIECMTVLFMS